jgi:DNA polymerase-3 subunit delta'
MRFKEIIGQIELKTKLLNLVKVGRISHTQLFLGPQGSGNLALAVAFSQYINCLNPLEEDSCGECASCVKFEKLIHPDLHFTIPTISPIKKSNELAEEWRKNFLKNPYLNDFDWLNTLDSKANKQGNITAEECRDIIHRLALTSYEAKYKTQIIWQPELLVKEGNILLKLLEEPPVGTLIILVGSNTEKILPTILSRAQTIKIPKLLDEEISSALIQFHQCDYQKASDIARLSDGNFNMALSLLHSGHDGYFERYSAWMRCCFAGKVDELQKWVEEINETGREYVKNFMGYTSQMMRAAFIYKYGDAKLLRVNAEELAFIAKFSAFINQENLSAILQSLDEAVNQAERNANVKILFLNLSLYIGSQLKHAPKHA